MTKVTLIPGDGIGPEVVEATRRIIEAAGADDRVGNPAGRRERVHAGSRHGRARGHDRVDPRDPRRPEGAARDAGRVRREERERDAPQAVRDVREHPPGAGAARDRHALLRAGASTSSSSARTSRTSTRASSTCRRPGVAQCLKLISRKGCEKIVRLAFEFARAEGRTTVHCATKSNIMKLTEGTLKRTFEEVAPEYPDIEAHHIIVDNCAHQLVKRPEQFDVIVMTNMNGDILSDLSSALVGGLGFAPSANLGSEVAIFEAVHGSAPKYAGKNVINPTALILSGVMLLRHLGEFDAGRGGREGPARHARAGEAHARRPR